MNLSFRSSLLIFVYILSITISHTVSQSSQVQHKQLQLNTLSNFTNISPGYSYYKLPLTLTYDSNNILMITVQSSNKQFLGIYVNIDYNVNSGQIIDKYPTYDNNMNSCSYFSFDTCALWLADVQQDKNVVVYIGVETISAEFIKIQVSLEGLFPAEVGHKYKVDFTQYQSAIITLESQDIAQYQQVIVQMKYSQFQSIGKFTLYAGIGKLPNNFDSRIQSKNAGAFTQLLILTSSFDVQTFYIVIEGEKGSKFDLSIQPFSVSAPSIKVNDTIHYYSTQETVFQASIPVTVQNEQDILPLVIDLAALGGYGQFKVDYCDSLTNYTFKSLNGLNGQIIIPKVQRKKCFDIISSNGGLIIQNIIVNVTNILYHFSFSIGLFEGQYPLDIQAYNQKLGTLLAEQTSRTYSITGFINQTFILKYKTMSGEQKLNFTLYECRMLLGKQRCTKSLDSNTNSYIDPVSPDYFQFIFVTYQKKQYKLQISHSNLSPLDSEYIILLLPMNPKQYPLTPSKSITNIIQQDQYQYYLINLTSIKLQLNITTLSQKSKIKIIMDQTNGQCILLTSLTRERPNFQMLFQADSDVSYTWNGRKTYQVNNQTKFVYVAVLGSMESIYHIQMVVQVNQDVPEKYVKLIGDKMLSYTLTEKQNILYLKYTAHSIPYTIIISPTPSCIKWGYSFPIQNNQCRDLPDQFTEKTIYMKLSNDKLQKDMKISVFVYSGTHFLYEYTPVMIACLDECFEFVSVYLQKQSAIVHQGMGSVSLRTNQSSSDNQSYSNSKMYLKCQKSYPCFVTINASLPYGGQMQLFYDSDNIQQIQWITKPLTFKSTMDYKYFYMPIRSYSSLNTAIFYTQGISVSIYYNIYAIKEDKMNAIEYGFPNGFDYMGKLQGNPLRRYHILEFDPKIIQQLGCKDDMEKCIATLAVIPNTSVDYSNQYVQNSIGYFSANTFKYYIPINQGYQMSEQYSLIYFTHEFRQIDTISQNYYVKVQPLSSCRPQIFNSYNLSNQQQQMPYYGIYKISSKQQKISQTRKLSFMISTDTPCEYTVWLLDSDIKPVIDNVKYQLTSDQNGDVVFVFSDKYLWEDKQFTVVFDKVMSQIAIAQYSKNTDGSIKYPDNKNNVAIISQAKQLKFDNDKDSNTHLYIIRGKTNIGQKVHVEVKDKSLSTILLPNQQNSFQFDQKTDRISYLFYTNNDFLILAYTNSGTVKLTVTNFNRDQQTIIQKYLTQNTQQTWFSVKAVNSDIQMYLITFENVVFMNNKNIRNLQDVKFPKIKVHIEETGTIGLPKLYQGIAQFDAFYQEDAENCYKYQSEGLVGRHDLNIDIIFGSEFLNKVPPVNYRLSMSTNNQLKSNSTSLPTGYRIHTQYYGGQTYQICFSIDHQSSLVSKQFYIIVQNQGFSLKHITLDRAYSSQNPSIYEIFQYIATQDQFLMVQVVNCHGKNTLLGSMNYDDIYLGQVSQLDIYYKDDIMSIAKTSVKFGYYYFGVKLNTFDDRYKIRVQVLKKSQKVHYDKFKLKDKVITKMQTLEGNDRKIVSVEVPQILFINPTNQLKVSKITYNLLVDDTKQQHDYSSYTLAKCPNLSTKKLTNFTYVHYQSNQKQNMKLLTDGNYNDIVTITIPVEYLPEKFNLTGSAVIQISQPQPQTLTYYYQSSSFVYDQNSGKHKGLGIFTIILLISTVVGSIAAVYFVYKRWKSRRIKTKVAFQMATYNHEDPSAKHQDISQSSPSKSIRKALNQNVGYGEFVDQSM